ncbi:hypothetical protein [Cohnella mopanensis]|uniref:hypothetical protein n=1 Tax=Cohnella mopanensis TaxID=2911966 RepID=UPI001EF9A90C|nr:hypothetical protein [Cohnella mopanensis]
MSAIHKLIMYLALCILIASTGCSSNNDSISEKVPSVIGKSTSCDAPPKFLNWLGKSYRLMEMNTKLEPGMKFGFVQCENGRYSNSDNDGPNQLIVYSNGESRDHNDFLLFGIWGRALYTMQE